MIDVESLVFDKVATAIRTAYPNAYVVGEYVEAPSTFPCVCIVEDSNTTYTRSQDNALSENHANLMYSVDVFSNKQTGKKLEAKAIAKIADEELQKLKMTRTFMGQTPNVDRSIYRITARYTVVVAKGVTSGETTTYQVYRK